MSNTESLMEFPCDFPIKAIGEAGFAFDAVVVEIVNRHAQTVGEGAVTTRESRGGRYLAVTVTVRAQSREQLDAIYQDLTADPRVTMAL
ncbi:MAG: DUF493 domain-containing protein [Chromatiales bacterium]|nr:DUF493 domain-containing protein [Chromatiales bacterium]